MKIEKACEIVNKCNNYQVISLDEIRAIILDISVINFNEFKTIFIEKILKELSVRIVQQEECRYYSNIVK